MVGPFQNVSDVYDEGLEAFHLQCGPIDMDRGLLPLQFPVVNNQILYFVDVE